MLVNSSVWITKTTNYWQRLQILLHTDTHIYSSSILPLSVYVSKYICSYVNRMGKHNDRNRFRPSEPSFQPLLLLLSILFCTIYFGSFMFLDVSKCLTLLINVCISVCASEQSYCFAMSPVSACVI